MFEVRGISYGEVIDYVYQLAYAALEQNLGTIEIIYKGEVWQAYNFLDGRDGSSPGLVIKRESEGWEFYSTFFYCRYAKKITGFKHEGWEIDIS
jgi:hypothetical protein